jgi:hypothetical protein
MKTYYASIPAKNADDVVTALRELEKSQTVDKDQEVEIRQVIPMGQKALVLYVVYEQGALQ